MTTFEKRLHDGSRATEILENEQFTASFDAIEQEIVQKWMNSSEGDRDGRERCWQYLTQLRKVRDHLTSTMATGKLAQLELRHQRTTAEKLRAMLSPS